MSNGGIDPRIEEDDTSSEPGLDECAICIVNDAVTICEICEDQVCENCVVEDITPSMEVCNTRCILCDEYMLK